MNKKRVLITAVIVFVFGSVVYGDPWPGSGDVNDPYLIHNAQQMQAIGADANYWSAHFKLMKDVDLGGYTGTSFNVIGNNITAFRGVFDGDGHTISNFTYNSNGIDRIGLFGYIEDPNAEVRDLGLIEPDVNAGTGGYVGCLVGYLTDGTVTNCYVEGGSVTGEYSVGGLVGDLKEGTVTNCYVEGGSVSGINGLGGLVGYNFSGTVSDCYVDDTSVSDSGDFVGGLVGINGFGSIRNCYSTGSVTGGDYVGGLVGGNGPGSIRNCYSTGDVTGGGHVGGLVGYNEAGYGEVINCYWDTESSGIDTGYWGVGLTTADMHAKHTFFLWGCEGGWTIDDGNDYPRLAWEGKPGEVIDLGCGTEEEPYLVYRASSMYVIGGSGDYNKHYKLMADIDVGGYIWTSLNIIGDYPGWPVYGTPFSGVFDGNGHTISNFTYESNEIDYIGLFGSIDALNAEVKNLGLIDPNVGAGTGDRIGGLVGYLGQGSITGCYIKGGSVTGNRSVGGLVGLVDDNGGYGSISNCYSTCNVTGESEVGGLVGSHFFGDMNDCYSTGIITGGSYAGGLVGYSRKLGFIRNSYWDVNSSGTDWSDGGLGLTTEQMQSKGTFLFWGCEPTWTIDDGNDYPRLLWEGKPGEVIEGSGCGTEEEPYLIYEGSSMYVIGAICSRYNQYCDDCDNLDKHYRLMADVDMSGYTGASFNVIGITYYNNFFTGVFDGNNHTISNFTYDSNGVDYIGLFGYVCCGGEIKDVVLINPDVDAGNGSYVGALVGYLGLNDLVGCRVEGGRVTGGDYVGGLVGLMGDEEGSRSISNCHSTAGVTGHYYVGGLVGQTGRTGEILNCCSRGVVTGVYYVGGLVGWNNFSIHMCYSGSSVTGGDRGVGGLVGHNNHDISNSYSTGDVTGENYVGGLLGANRGSISNCYSTGSVDGSDLVGGLVGYGGGIYYTKCFWDSDVNPDVNGIGDESDPNVVGLPTVLMQTESTFTDAGWDFVGETVNGTEDIWKMNCEGMSYPKLSWWEPALGDFICPDGVNMLDFAILGDAWFTDPNMANWDPACDISEPNDNFIDALDLDIFSDNYLSAF